MAKFSPATFAKQVKSETKKVVWPSRREAMISTIAVFIMVTFASIFLFAADQLMSFVVKLILDLGM